MASKRKVIVISDDEDVIPVKVPKRRKVIVISDDEEEELEIPTEDEFEDVSDLPVLPIPEITNVVTFTYNVSQTTRSSIASYRIQRPIKTAGEIMHVMNQLRMIRNKKCAVESCRTTVRAYGRNYCSIHHKKMQQRLYGIRSVFPSDEVSVRYMCEARRMLMKKDDTYPAHEKILKLAKRLYKEDNMYM